MKKMLPVTRLSVLAALATVMLTGCGPQYLVLNPQGPVAQKELEIIVLSAILIAIVVIPVFIIFGYILYRYRDKPGNKAPYMPEWSESKVAEVVWWGIPIVIVAVLGAATAKTTFALTEPPAKQVKPITIQVTSLDWKWLFTYPDQKVASVNYVEIPVGVPVQFELTSDAPMNSFWVPQLAGQMYTMPGMSMRLWLQADKAGEYYGSAANFTGEKFAHMKFKVVAKPQSEFNAWVEQVKQTAPALTKDGYAKLAQPGITDVAFYSSYPAGLYEEIVMKNGGQYYHHDMVSGAMNQEMNNNGPMNHNHMNHDLMKHSSMSNMQ